MEEHYPTNQPLPQPQYQQSYQPQPHLRNLSNDTAILVLGICSIVFSMCYGIVGLGLGIAALIMSKGALKEYRAAPHLYAPSSLSNVNAGRTCAIIGLVIGGLVLLTIVAYILIYALFLGVLVSTPFLA